MSDNSQRALPPFPPEKPALAHDIVGYRDEDEYL